MDPILFFKIWRNKYLLNLIFYHLRLSNSLYNNIIINDNNFYKFLKILNNDFKNKNFIDYYFKKNDNNQDNNNNEDDNETFKILIQHIKSIKFDITSKFLDILPEILNQSLPSNIDSIEIFSLPNCPIPNTIKELTILGNISNSKKNLMESLITKLIFSRGIEQLEYLPKNLVYLDLGYIFNKPIYKNVLPSTLETLILSNNFNKPIIEGSLPNSITSLHFGDQFNQPIRPHQLPSNLLKISFGFDYFKEIEENALPNTIEEIKFNNNYLAIKINCNYLPKNLKSFKSNSTSLKKFIGSFPDGIEKIKLYGYSKKIEPDLFPDSLKSLVIYKNENSNSKIQVIQKLPKSLTSICVPHSVYFSDSTFLECKNLKKIKGINRLKDIEKLPESCKSLSFNIAFNEPIEENSIPNQIEKIKFYYGSQYNHHLNNLIQNKNLKSIKLYNHYQTLNDISQLDQLESLIFGYNSRTRLFKLPINLTTLHFGQLFRDELNIGDLPPTLTRLVLTEYPLVIKKDVLPKSLLYLRFIALRKRVNEPIENSILPSSITCLEIGSIFTTREISKNWLPSSLNTLIICSSKTRVSNDILNLESIETIYIIKENQIFSNIQDYDLDLYLKLKSLSKKRINKLFNKL